MNQWILRSLILLGRWTEEALPHREISSAAQHLGSPHQGPSWHWPMLSTKQPPPTLNSLFSSRITWPVVFPYSSREVLSMCLLTDLRVSKRLPWGKAWSKKSYLKPGASITTGAEGDESAKGTGGSIRAALVLCLLHSSLAESMDQPSLCVPCLEQTKKPHQIPAFCLPPEMCQHL